MSDSDDSDTIYSTPRQVKNKINAYLRKGIEGPTAFCKRVGIPYSSYQRFMTSKEPRADNQTFYAAYKFFEKERSTKKTPKSKKRRELEEAVTKQRQQEEARRDALAPHHAAVKLLMQHYPHVGKAVSYPLTTSASGGEQAQPIPTASNPKIVELVSKGWSQLGALLAVIDLGKAFRYTFSEPAPWKAEKPMVDLARGSRNSRMDREIDYCNSMDAFSNFQRLQNDVEIAREAKEDGRVITKQLPSKPPPLELEIDIFDGSVKKRKRSPSFELEGDHSQCCCDRVRKFGAVYISMPPKPRVQQAPLAKIAFTSSSSSSPSSSSSSSSSASSSSPTTLESKGGCTSCGGTDHKRRNSNKCPMNKKQRTD